VNDSGPSHEEVENYNQELQALLDYRHQIYEEIVSQQEVPVDPFDEVFNGLADVILAASRTYIGLRSFQRLIESMEEE